MPQRRRRGKPRLTRMDAAVDAMSQLGFQERLVKKCVKQLLKEYGGDEAWPFIEDSSYRELIEAILRDNEENDQGSSSRVGGEVGETTPKESWPKNTLPGTETASETSKREAENAQEVNLHNSAETDCSKILTSSPGIITSDEGHGTSWKEIVEDQTYVSTRQTYDQRNEAVNANGKAPLPNMIEAVHKVTSSPTMQRPVSISPLPADKSSSPCNGWIMEEDDDDAIEKSKSSSLLPTADKQKSIGRRFPCYGWIEEDEDSSPPTTDMACSKPALESKDSSSLLQIADKQKKTAKRLPCYGWIEECEDDSSPTIDFVYSTPANGSFGPKAEALRKPSLGGRKRKKSRWDEGPEC